MQFLRDTIKPVSRRIKIALLALLLVLVPLRAMAEMTIGFCAFPHHDSAAGAGAAADHGAAHHEHGKTPDSNGAGDHCASVSFLASAAPLSLPAAAAADLVVRGERFAAGFVPDHLDPPPLAL